MTKIPKIAMFSYKVDLAIFEPSLLHVLASDGPVASLDPAALRPDRPRAREKPPVPPMARLRAPGAGVFFSRTRSTAETWPSMEHTSLLHVRPEPAS